MWRKNNAEHFGSHDSVRLELDCHIFQFLSRWSEIGSSPWSAWSASSLTGLWVWLCPTWRIFLRAVSRNAPHLREDWAVPKLQRQFFVLPCQIINVLTALPNCLRDGWHYQNGWIFGKNSNSPLQFGKLYCNFFSENVRKKPYIKVQNLQYKFFDWKCSPPPFWKFSEHSSVLVAWPVP